MKKIGWTTAMTVIALSLLVAVSAGAEYRPDAEFVAKMQQLLKSASFLTIRGPFVWKEIRAGRPFEEGNVAYYGISADASHHFESGSYLQLEEWKRQPNGRFLVTYTVMRATRAYKWSWLSGTLITTEMEELNTASQEVIMRSRLAQQLLLERGRPVMVDGEDI